jgi:tetratricopeptide (TPR) repeat protein/tRNA A-37 threonylcarbamoyl transferase component Bud32
MPTENEFDKQDFPDDPGQPPKGDRASGPPADDSNHSTTAPPTVPWVASPESIAVPTDNVGTWLTRGDGAPPPLEEYIPLPSVPGYEVLEELGRGGMGVVYKARQKALNRVVALKMIRDSALAGPQERARFRKEAEAVAELHHPGIVQIYELDECRGLPYFSMELMEGGNLAALLEKGPLASREAARLIEAIARAIHAAHEKGIVHRDLKPANVLLTSGGREPSGEAQTGVSRPPLAGYIPKVADFGLAKRLGGLGTTATGQVMGTPEYMAPEQAAGRTHDISPRTDVYSLGALLYQCLTGRRPFQGGTLTEVLRQVTQDEPVPLRRLRRVHRDLETICLKCLEKDPKKRYPSALELADDLHRFLVNEPIQARPVHRFERLWRRACRSPGRSLVIAVALVAAAVLGVLALTGHFSVEREAERRERSARAAEAKGNRTLALGHYAEALEIYERLRKHSPATPRYRFKAAALRLLTGDLRRKLGLRDEAKQDFEDARQALEELCEDAPGNAEWKRHLAEAHHNLGVLSADRGRHAEAAGSYRQALTLRKEALLRKAGLDEDLDQRVGWADLADHPDNRSFLRDLARGYGYLGDTELALGKGAAALLSYRRSEAIRRELAQVAGSDAEARFQYARAVANFARYYDWADQRGDAVQWYQKTLELQRCLLEQDCHPDYLADLADTCDSLGELLLDDGKNEAALGYLSESRKALEAILGQADNRRDRLSPQSLCDQARNQMNLAKGFLRGNRARARACLDEAKDFLDRLRESRGLLNQTEYLMRARYHALAGELDERNRADEKGTAIQWLSEAIKEGYRNRAQLRRDVGFPRWLRQTAEFRRLEEKLEALLTDTHQTS